jgi:hypothetical protein
MANAEAKRFSQASSYSQMSWGTNPMLRLAGCVSPRIAWPLIWNCDNQRSDVFRSTDGTMTWHPAGSGLSGNVNSIALDRRNQSIVYAGTTTGLYQFSPDVPRGPRPVRK